MPQSSAIQSIIRRNRSLTARYSSRVAEDLPLGLRYCLIPVRQNHRKSLPPRGVSGGGQTWTDEFGLASQFFLAGALAALLAAAGDQEETSQPAVAEVKHRVATLATRQTHQLAGAGGREGTGFLSWVGGLMRDELRMRRVGQPDFSRGCGQIFVKTRKLRNSAVQGLGCRVLATRWPRKRRTSRTETRSSCATRLRMAAVALPARPGWCCMHRGLGV
jgi:hypothetical protein